MATQQSSMKDWYFFLKVSTRDPRKMGMASSMVMMEESFMKGISETTCMMAGGGTLTIQDSFEKGSTMDMEFFLHLTYTMRGFSLEGCSMEKESGSRGRR
jgi:hypothetical protein